MEGSDCNGQREGEETTSLLKRARPSGKLVGVACQSSYDYKYYTYIDTNGNKCPY